MSIGADNSSWVRPLGSAVDGDFHVAVGNHAAWDAEGRPRARSAAVRGA